MSDNGIWEIDAMELVLTLTNHLGPKAFEQLALSACREALRSGKMTGGNPDAIVEKSYVGADGTCPRKEGSKLLKFTRKWSIDSMDLLEVIEKQHGDGHSAFMLDTGRKALADGVLVGGSPEDCVTGFEVRTNCSPSDGRNQLSLAS